MWKLYHSAPYGSRIDYNWRWVSVPGMWFVHDQQKWVKDGEQVNCRYASLHHKKPKSVKAFMRYLKKHPELKGHKVTLVNRYYYTSDDFGTWWFDYHIDAVFE